MIPVTRYFTDDYAFWKFEHGQPPRHRFYDEPDWEESGFASLIEFEEAPGEVQEITPEKGEP